MKSTGETVDTGFVVITNDRLSPADLGNLVNQGEAVMRTPHVGNWGLYNGVFAKLGITMVAHDLTVPQVDRNYHPGDQIVGRKATRVIPKDDMGRLVTHIRTMSSMWHPRDTGLPDAFWAQPDERVVDTHLRALRSAYPEAPISTTTGYLLEREARTADIMRTLAQANLGEWKRHADPEGVTQVLDGSPADLVAKYGIFRDGSARGENEGMLPPVTATILALSIHDALEHNTDTVYHVSGPDMICYITKPEMRAELQTMYAAIKRSPLGTKLPQTLKFHILPGTGSRLTVPAAQQANLDALIITCETMSALADELKEAAASREALEVTHKAALRAREPNATALASDATERLRTAKKAYNAHVTAFQQAATACAAVFAPTDKGRYGTQYDVLADANGQYIHPVVYARPLGELATLSSELAGYVVR